jgi:hypothetical protein
MSDIASTGFNPNISRFKRLAKALRKAVEAGDAEAVERVTAQDVDPSTPFALRSAQLVIAREQGFAGWHEFIEDAGERMVDERDIHRWFGVSLNNKSWEIIDDATDVSSWPPHRVDEALYGAYASAYHWMQVGTPMHQGRAESVITRMAVILGRPELALHHAERYVDIVARHPDLAEDWDIAFTLEGKARALAAAGRLEEASAMKRSAEEACALIADPEDREIVEQALVQEPWFGVRARGS